MRLAILTKVYSGLKEAPPKKEKRIFKSPMGLLGYLVLFLTLSSASWGKLLVLEYKAQGQDSYHGDTVKHIACNDADFYCELYNTEFFLEDFKVNMSLKVTQFDVINMSLTFQKPELKDSEIGKSDFRIQKENVSNLIYNNENVLFVVAAGNGFELGFIPVPSVPLVDHYKMYPASLESENLIKVTAVNEKGLGFEELEAKTLGSRVNYGVELVDVAAVVEPNHLGEVLVFTSTATPHVAKLAARLKEKYETLSAKQIKEIIMKTVYVKNLERVLELEEDFQENKETSLLGRLNLETNYNKREELREEIGDVLLVKSGGTVVPDVALLCAELFYKAMGLLNLEQSCLEAQKNKIYLNEYREEQLKRLWDLRGI